jgi:small conductance mechanosensitive channel
VEEGIQEIGMEVEMKMNRLQQYFSDHLPDVISFAIRVVIALVVFWIGIKLIKWILKVTRRSLEKSRIDEGVTQFACSMLKFLLYAMLIFNIAIYFGVKESSVAALLGTAGVAIGLGIQGGLANIAGGLLLLLFKPFQVGDYIIQDQAAGCEGTVVKIEICYTTLLSVDNKHVVIPNGTLSNSTIINVTARDQRKLEIKVGISYQSDVQKSKEILRQLLLQDPDTKNDDDMMVYVDELGENSIIMGMRAWVPTDRYWPAKWRLNEQIKEEFDKNGIQKGKYDVRINR